MRIAVIPARGGSKRIPRKNVKLFAGRPMITWSIEAAQASGLFDRIVVSTDDQEVADVAQASGAEVPFLRPAELADDYTPTIPVISHAIRWVAEHWAVPTLTCCIYATAPFIRASDLIRGAAMLDETDADFALPVTSYPFPIQRAVRLNCQGRMEMFSPEHAQTRSQDLVEAYHDVGQFYWGRTNAWLTETSLIGSCSVPIVIPRHRAQDIDTHEDWLRAEIMFSTLAKLGADTQ